MSTETNRRLDDINQVSMEKELMVIIGKELLELSRHYPEKIDELTFGKKALEFIKHLSMLGGFCDKRTQSAISAVVREFTALMIDPNMLENFTDTKVRMMIPMAIGIQVDFTKRPFRVFGLDVKAFHAQVKAIVKR